MWSTLEQKYKYLHFSTPNFALPSHTKNLQTIYSRIYCSQIYEFLTIKFGRAKVFYFLLFFYTFVCRCYALITTILTLEKRVKNFLSFGAKNCAYAEL